VQIHLAGQPAADLDRLEAASKRLGQRTLHQTLEALLKLLESHCLPEITGRGPRTGIHRASDLVTPVRAAGPRRRRDYCWPVTRASGGIGRRAGFRFLCPKGCAGSSPASPTTSREIARFADRRGRPDRLLRPPDPPPRHAAFQAELGLRIDLGRSPQVLGMPASLHSLVASVRARRPILGPLHRV
jgi:hypothetical protein